MTIDSALGAFITSLTTGVPPEIGQITHFWMGTDWTIP